MITIILLFILLFNGAQTLHSQCPKTYYLWLDEVDKRETIEMQIPVPQGYRRTPVPPKSFAQWLRGLPLLPKGTSVKDYTGRIRVTAQDTSLTAVINYRIRGKKLEQCMDIIIRLKAEYLKALNRSDEIAFFLPGSYLLKWTDWVRGLHPEYHGIRVTLQPTHPPDSSRSSFEEYLREIFYHSYTQTAYVGYTKVKPEDMQIGDFIVKKGNHGHAVLIVDMATDQQGRKIILVGHGDTPARQFYLLSYKKDQPWFPVNTTDKHLPLPIKKKMTWDGLRRF